MINSIFGGLRPFGKYLTHTPTRTHTHTFSFISMKNSSVVNLDSYCKTWKQASKAHPKQETSVKYLEDPCVESKLTVKGRDFSFRTKPLECIKKRKKVWAWTRD